MAEEIIRLTARAAGDALAAGELTPADLLEALEARIAAVDGKVNALPTLCFERAHAHGARIAAGAAPAGVLHGLPVAIKDLTMVAGVRSTYASPIFADHVPDMSDHIVERIEARGGVVYAKSNTPEFGAGASTFNEVFGRTFNPHDLTRSPAGSSGGAAAALASGTAWLAHGSDLAGSCRTPASFCGVVGLRPSVGRVPNGPSANPLQALSVEGPLARNVGDLGLFLDAMAGADPREPLTESSPAIFRAAAEAPRVPRRVAYSPDLGITPVDPQVARICEAAARRLEAMGAVVEEAHPDFSGAHDAFQTLRGMQFVTGLGALYASHRDLLKPDVRWNIERGLAVTAEEHAAALIARGRIVAAAAAFFERYDLLLCPTAIVLPFAADQRMVEACAGQAFETYIDWLAIVFAPTLACLPALSLPCGFADGALPIGLQMIGPARGEAALLSMAAALEAELALDLGPIDPRG